MSENPIFDGMSDNSADTPVYNNVNQDLNTTPNRWIPSKPVRMWLYGICVAIAALLVAYGFMTIEQGGLWLVLLAAILGVGNAVAGRNVPRG